MSSITARVAFDFETYKIESGLGAPKIVCGAFFDGKSAHLLARDASGDLLTKLLRNPNVTLIGHNLAFDLACALSGGLVKIDDVIAALEADRIRDTRLVAGLDQLAKGSFELYRGRETHYSLEDCVKIFLGRDNAKQHDAWRLRYGELDGIPIAQWPAEAREYPLDDVRNTYALDTVLAASANRHEVTRQTRYALPLALGGFSGLAFDAVLGRARYAGFVKEREALGDQLAQFLKRVPDAEEIAGYKWSKDTRNIRRAVCHAYASTLVACAACQGSGERPPKVLKSGKLSTARKQNCSECGGVGYDAAASGVPLTKGDGVKADRDTLQESGDDELEALARFDAHAKLVNQYLPEFIEQAEKRGVVTWGTEVLKETGRTSLRGGMGNMPRKNLRDCFRAPDGKVWIFTDYTGMELVTHAQNCLNTVGYSKLADVLNADGKPHNLLAAKMAGMSEAELFGDPKLKVRAKGFRTAAKAANFGYPGGMSAETLVLAKRKEDFETITDDGRVYAGIRFCVCMRGAKACGVRKTRKALRTQREIAPSCLECVEAAHELRDAWFQMYPENKDYFTWVKQQLERGLPHVAHVSRRVRACESFSAFANSGFQALGADAAKEAMWRVWRATVTGDSILRRSEFKAFFHDEIAIETDADPDVVDATVRAKLAIMIGTFKGFCPDVKIGAEPAVQLRWYKEAEPVFDAQGRYTSWQPKK